MRNLLLGAAFLLLASGISADTLDSITFYSWPAPAEITGAGLALCPSVNACWDSTSNALASFYFSGDGTFTVDASNPAFAPIADYLTMSDQQIVNTVLWEALVPFVTVEGYDYPLEDYVEGHFGQSYNQTTGIATGEPFAGSQLDSLIVTINGRNASWVATGKDVAATPEPSTEFLLVLGIFILLGIGGKYVRI